MATEVYLNSKFIGTIDNPIEFVQKIREDRRKGAITENLNVYYNEKANEIQLEGSKGRARRPLIIVKDGVPLLTEKHIKQLEKNEISWSDLVKQGIIEYLDAAEEENALGPLLPVEIFAFPAVRESSYPPLFTPRSSARGSFCPDVSCFMFDVLCWA